MRAGPKRVFFSACLDICAWRGWFPALALQQSGPVIAARLKHRQSRAWPISQQAFTRRQVSQWRFFLWDHQATLPAPESAAVPRLNHCSLAHAMRTCIADLHRDGFYRGQGRMSMRWADWSFVGAAWMPTCAVAAF